MPATPPPTPPDPLAVIRQYNRRPPKGPGPSRAVGSYPESRRQGLASDPTWGMFGGATPQDVLGAADIQGDTFETGVLRELVTDIGPYQTLSYLDNAGNPLTTTTGGYFANTAGSFFSPKTTSNFDPVAGGIDVEKTTDTAVVAYISSVGKWPADITLAPTSTIYPPRPRTVAAGYDGNRKVLTVVFRDGTFYNYYGVAGGQWANFVRARSKGRFIRTYLDAKVRGVADAGGMPQAHRELLYKAARTTQTLREGLQHGHSKRSKRGTGYGSKIGGTGRARAKRAAPPAPP